VLRSLEAMAYSALPRQLWAILSRVMTWVGEDDLEQLRILAESDIGAGHIVRPVCDRRLGVHLAGRVEVRLEREAPVQRDAGLRFQFLEQTHRIVVDARRAAKFPQKGPLVALQIVYSPCAHERRYRKKKLPDRSGGDPSRP
jgi:hypothetical protein